MDAIKGLHHVTAVARDPQRNIDFYRNILGQRLVKRTVNFDVPDTYHFYFADETGTPGSILTFFAWPNTRRGVRGNAETNAVAYNVPVGSLVFWQEHLKRNGITFKPVENRFGEAVLALEDPDGMYVELIESQAEAPIRFWEAGPIPQAYALRGFHSVTLWLDQWEPTAELLTNHMGYTAAGTEGNRYRYVGDRSYRGYRLSPWQSGGGLRQRFHPSHRFPRSIR
jgi:glyoxalase family protein